LIRSISFSGEAYNQYIRKNLKSSLLLLKYDATAGQQLKKFKSGYEDIGTV